MFNYKLTLEYLGAGFHGWQAQSGFKTVQGVLEKALKGVTDKKSVTIHSAGRTDAGVHAEGQTASVCFQEEFSPDRLLRGTNFYMKSEAVRVISVKKVPLDFHARFSATQRQYRYRILNRSVEAPLRQEVAWWVQRTLDVGAMAEAAKVFQGHHDFSAFRGRFCQSSSPFKTMDQSYVQVEKDEVHFFCASRSFLHHQVRLMVGTLVEVGLGKRKISSIAPVLKQGKRGEAGMKAPSQGLCLVAVRY